MPQSLVKNYIHISFSTKDRYPFIDNIIKNEYRVFLKKYNVEYDERYVWD